MLSLSEASLVPGLSCTVLGLLCFAPESSDGLICVFQQLPGCPCPSSSLHTSGHTHVTCVCRQRCTSLRIALDMGRETYGLKHMCICFPSQIYFGKYESAAAAAAAGKNILHNLWEPRKPCSLLGERLSASSSFYHHLGAAHWHEPLSQWPHFHHILLCPTQGSSPRSLGFLFLNPRVLVVSQGCAVGDYFSLVP